MWPDTPPAAATVAAIIGINLGIWALWKVPPAWRLLNRYFISVAACPRPLSNVGAVFSHQSLKHLGMNMLVLYYSGTKRMSSSKPPPATSTLLTQSKSTMKSAEATSSLCTWPQASWARSPR